MNTTEMIISFFKNYGWQLTVLATTGIILLGVLKSFGTFKKVPIKGKKYLYYGISCILSILACTGYILIKHSFEWKTYLILIAGIIGYTSALYTLYENTGIRDVLKKLIFIPLKKLFSTCWKHIVEGSLDKNAVIELASSYGVDVANQIINTAVEKEAEKKQLEAEKKKAEQVVEVNANASQVVITNQELRR